MSTTADRAREKSPLLTPAKHTGKTYQSFTSTNDGKKNENEKFEKYVDEKEEETKNRIGQKKRFGRRKDAWLSSRFDVQSISTVDQSFIIHAFINIFWIDQRFMNNQCIPKLQKSKENEEQKQKIETIQTFNYDEFKELFPNYRLPLNANKLFKNTIEITKEPTEEWQIWMNPLTNTFRLYIEFEGALFEHLETENFPFDGQFLNIKLLYTPRYNFVTLCPEWVNFNTPYQYHLPIQVTKFDAMSEWDLLPPWIDFRREKWYINGNNVGAIKHLSDEEKQELKDNIGTKKDNFALIRLRVVRNPTYHFVYIILPTILIISCSFAIFALEIDDIGDRLSYLLTVLLTVVLFQTTISDALPEGAKITHLDKFILLCYFMEIIFILYVSFGESLNYDDELIASVILTALWIFGIIWFILRPWLTKNDWIKMSDNEYYEMFGYGSGGHKNTMMKQNCLFYGSDHKDGGFVIEETKEMFCHYKVTRISGGERKFEITPLIKDSNLYNEYLDKCDDKINKRIRIENERGFHNLVSVNLLQTHTAQ